MWCKVRHISSYIYIRLEKNGTGCSLVHVDTEICLHLGGKPSKSEIQLTFDGTEESRAVWGFEPFRHTLTELIRNGQHFYWLLTEFLGLNI